MNKTIFVPCTPGGTLCFHIKADSEQKAIDKLLVDAAHMPYKAWANFQKRGYTIEEMDDMTIWMNCIFTEVKNHERST